MPDMILIDLCKQVGSILHAQLEIWKAAFVDSAQIDINILTSPTAGLSSSQSNADGFQICPQTSRWNQMLDDDSDISDGNFFA